MELIREYPIHILFFVCGLLAAGGCRTVSPSKEEAAPISEETALHNAVVSVWGEDNACLPTPLKWVEYESDLGERHVIDFEKGTVTVQLLLPLHADMNEARIAEHLQQGVRNASLSSGVCPYEMQRNGEIEPVPAGRKAVFYEVQRGDTLWGVARAFQVDRSQIAAANGLSNETHLKIGQTLVIPPSPPHRLEKTEPPSRVGAPPILEGQLMTKDGEIVTRENVDRFASGVCSSHDLAARNIVGADGVARKEVSLTFKLADDHLQTRAMKYRPIVAKYAGKRGVDPALIMAMIHTESHFNPRARSSAPAYGLMQIVPRTAGKEAMRHLFDKDLSPEPNSLYEPDYNVRLGTAYIHVLQNRYFGRVSDPKSRTYCSVAGYNGGPTAVRQAFGKSSLTEMGGAVNSMEPKDVYMALKAGLASQETKGYLEKVNNRIALYR